MTIEELSAQVSALLDQGGQVLAHGMLGVTLHDDPVPMLALHIKRGKVHWEVATSANQSWSSSTQVSSVRSFDHVLIEPTPSGWRLTDGSEEGLMELVVVWL